MLDHLSTHVHSHVTMRPFFGPFSCDPFRPPGSLLLLYHIWSIQYSHESAHGPLCLNTLVAMSFLFSWDLYNSRVLSRKLFLGVQCLSKRPLCFFFLWIIWKEYRDMESGIFPNLGKIFLLSYLYSLSTKQNIFLHQFHDPSKFSLWLRL